MTIIIFSLRVHSDVDPPDPIPNSEVKHVCADATWWEAAWESRTMRGVYFTERLKIEEQRLKVEKSVICPFQSSIYFVSVLSLKYYSG
jgi:hypothetical protein